MSVSCFVALRLFWVDVLLARSRKYSKRAAKLIDRSNECLAMAERHQTKIRAAASHSTPEASE